MDKESPPLKDESSTSGLETEVQLNKEEKISMRRRLFYVIPRFLVRQLYRMQYGYTKLNVFIQISYTVSLLLLLSSEAGFFEVLWWHLVIVYIGIIVLLIALVFIFEIFGAWHTEQRQIFRMSTSELWRDQIELQSLLFAKYTHMSSEEIDGRIEELSKRLFEK